MRGIAMYIVDRYQVEKVLFYGGHYVEEFDGIRIEISKIENKLKISEISINTNGAFKMPNIKGIYTYQEVQEIIDRNMVFMESNTSTKEYYNLIAYRLTKR